MFFPVEEIRRQFIEIKKGNDARETLTKRWRALKLPGRLYWRNRTNWRDWDGKAVACWKNSTVRIWYNTLSALEEEIEDAEYWQNDLATKQD